MEVSMGRPKKVKVVAAGETIMEGEVTKEVIKDDTAAFGVGPNGEVIPLTGTCKTDFSYMPELDGPVDPRKKQDPMRDPIPPSQMELDKMCEAIEGEKLAKPKSKMLKYNHKTGEIYDPMEGVPNNCYRCDELLAKRHASLLHSPNKKSHVALIIGGGFSWEPYQDMLKIKAQHTFGCSGTPLIFPELKHWYSCDIPKTQPMKDWFWNSGDTIKVLSYESYRDEFVPDDCYVTMTPSLGITRTPEKDGLWHGVSSSIGAIELARLMGYTKFYLFGVDYDSRSHPFDKVDPEQGTNKAAWDQARIGECWKRFVDGYVDFRLPIFNCNKESLLVKLNVMRYSDPYKAFQGE
jgi:hypothetical protein